MEQQDHKAEKASQNGHGGAEEAHNLAEELAEDGAASSGMWINGVPVTEMQAAHAQHGVLNRWMTFTLKLIPDLYEQIEHQQAANQELKSRLDRVEARIKKLAPEGEGEPAEAQAGDAGGEG